MNNVQEKTGIRCDDKLVLQTLQKYLSEDYLMGEHFQQSSPYKIVEYERVGHRRVRVGEYSTRFLRQFYSKSGNMHTSEAITASIAALKKRNINLYEALFVLWGRPLRAYRCHKSTVYRRLDQALRKIAKDMALL